MDDGEHARAKDDPVHNNAVAVEKVFAETFAIWDGVVHPRFRGSEHRFFFLTLGIIGVIFAIPLIFSSPPLSAWAGCHAAAAFGHGMSREAVMHWCDWFAIVFQLFIFIMIGGVAFTDSFAKRTEKTLKTWRDRLLAAEHQNEEKGATERRQQVNELLDMVQKPGDYASKIERIITKLTSDFNDARALPYRYVWFTLKGMGYNFPGGLYGLLGFVSLVLQIYALSSKIVLDHLPAACHWG